MPKFTYKGPVMEFNTLLADSWEGETVAPSEKKARNDVDNTQAYTCQLEG